MWKKIFSADSAVGRALTRIGEMVVLSVLWFFMSLPLVTMGASTTALYYTVVKSLRCGRGNTFKEYFKAWKQNFFKSTVLTLILFVVLLIMLSITTELGGLLNDIVNNGVASAFSDKSEQVLGLYIICGILLAILILLAIYSFPLLSRFDISIGRVLAMSFVMAIRFFYYSIALFVIAVALVYMVYRLPLGIMFAPALWAYFSSYMLEPALRKYTPEPEPDVDAWWYHS